MVLAAVTMRSQGEDVVQPGDVGEIARVIRDDDSLFYHARFNGYTFLVPEQALQAAPEGSKRAEPVLRRGGQA